MSYRARRILWPVLLWCLCGAPATGKEYWTYKTAYDAYDAGEYLLAADIYKRLADAGDARAQNDLGFMYTVGEGVQQDYRTAAMWFHKSAQQGHPPALIHLAGLYEDGRGVERDAIEAYKYLALAGLLTRDSNGKKIAISRRDEIAAGLTPAQLETARERACLWWRTHRADLEKGGRPGPGPPRYCAGG